MRAQKWRMQEGELWNAVDWYAVGYSTSDFPQFSFANLASLQENGSSVGTSLLGGTLVELQSQSATDPRWSWLVYENGTWTEVAKQNGTFALSDQFYQSTTVYGFDNFNFANVPIRDGSWEIRWMLDQFSTQLFTILQLNTLFFAMVRCALSLDEQLDWAIKTSFMYIGGYQEQLLPNPVTQTNLFNDILSYIDDVRPYHVKVRDYVQQYVGGPDICALAITDFDKPVYQDPALASSSALARVLNPITITSTSGAITGSTSDTEIVANNLPWQQWYNAYALPITTPDNWNENWNGVIRINTTMSVDRLSCISTEGWDLEPWDAAVTQYFSENDVNVGPLDVVNYTALANVYRNSASAVGNGVNLESNNPYMDVYINTTDDLSVLVSSGQTVVGTQAVVVQTGASYMWTGTYWQEYHNSGWDSSWVEDEATRLALYYQPSLDMIHADSDQLIAGCAYRYSILNGGTFNQDLWDIFPWDYASGWANEKAYYLGFQVPGSEETTTQPKGVEPPLTTDYQYGDAIVQAPGFVPTAAEISANLIDVTGAAFVDPLVNEGNPEELFALCPTTPLVITIKDTSVNQVVRIFQSDINVWEFTSSAVSTAVLANSLNQTSTAVVVNTGNSMFFDPANPIANTNNLVTVVRSQSHTPH